MRLAVAGGDALAGAALASLTLLYFLPEVRRWRLGRDAMPRVVERTEVESLGDNDDDEAISGESSSGRLPATAASLPKALWAQDAPAGGEEEPLSERPPRRGRRRVRICTAKNEAFSPSHSPNGTELRRPTVVAGTDTCVSGGDGSAALPQPAEYDAARRAPSVPPAASPSATSEVERATSISDVSHDAVETAADAADLRTALISGLSAQRLMSLLAEVKLKAHARQQDYITDFVPEDVLHLCAEHLRPGQEAFLEALWTAVPPRFRTLLVHDMTPVMLAVAVGQSQVAQRMMRLATPQELNARNSAKWTPLHLAASMDKAHLITELLRCGGARLNVAAENDHRSTALHLALSARHFDGSMTLIQHCVKDAAPGGAVAEFSGADAHGRTVLHLAVAAGAGFLPIVTEIARHNPELVHAATPPPQGTTPLHLSIASGLGRVSLTLLHHGARPTAADARGVTPLHLSSAADDVPMLRAMLKEIRDPPGNYLGNSNQDKSGDCDSNGVVHGRGSEICASAFAIRDNAGHAPLHVALLKRSSRAAEFLLKSGADPNLLTSSGVHPLSLALRGNLLSAAKTIIYDRRTTFGFTDPDDGGAPLFLQCCRAGSELTFAAEHILQQRSSNESRCRALPAPPLEAGVSVLQEAPGSSCEKSMSQELLFHLGKCSTVDGRYALHHAAVEGDSRLIAALLDCGAAAVTQDAADGSTPIDDAAAHGRADALELLLNDSRCIEKWALFPCARGLRERTTASSAMRRACRGFVTSAFDKGGFLRCVELLAPIAQPTTADVEELLRELRQTLPQEGASSADVLTSKALFDALLRFHCRDDSAALPAAVNGNETRDKVACAAADEQQSAYDAVKAGGKATSRTSYSKGRRSRLAAVVPSSDS